MAKDGAETGYAAQHDFMLQKLRDGSWQIVQDRQLEATGLMPLYIAEKFVDPSSPYRETKTN